MIFLNEDAIFASSISKSGKCCPSTDCDVKRSSTDLAISTSLIHDTATVGQPEQEHTSVLTLVFQHFQSSGSGNFCRMQFRDSIPRSFHDTVLRVRCSSTMHRIPGIIIPEKS